MSLHYVLYFLNSFNVIVSGVDQQLQHQTITIRKYPGGVDTESTLSNVTSIHSQLQSFNEPCDEIQKFYNSSQINHQTQHQHQQPSGSEKLIRPQVLRAMNKHSVLAQELHQRQTLVAANRTIGQQHATTTTMQQQQQHSSFVTGCTAAALTSTTNTVAANTNAAAANATASATTVLSPSKVATQAGGGGAGGGKTATILVSKSKTKTGLPLLLKNSINN
ncbi:uncharacterized protein [Eurosta solidaginis]|uniref:uncharacterized protein n=1 Tax=Eurosta solidaginis TaxID=178769 RepID=UPI00353167EA